MSAGVLVVVLLLAWAVVSVLVALVLGAVVARRDVQRPRAAPSPSVGRNRCCRSVPTRTRRRPRDHHS